MHLLYFNMFWLNVALWTMILLFYVVYSAAWVTDRCIVCWRRKKHEKCSHSIEIEMASIHDSFSENPPQTEGVVCRSTSLSALDGCNGLLQDGYTARLQQDEDTTVAASVSR
ncbi:uncharacterized protein [Macrobrachium rosenbergii]|uniref:uncharacterized protein n=1 Tax=Macrobrachium rosenbergii TaxID=79674 RepID=UPI0034D44004